MKWIHLGYEYYTCVDSESYEKVSSIIWRHTVKNYARARMSGGRDVFLHRYILGEPDCEIDHINRCPWDNRVSNLKKCSRWQNQQNKGLPLEVVLPSEEEKIEARKHRAWLKTKDAKSSLGIKRKKRQESRVQNELGEVFPTAKAAASKYGAPGGANIAQCCLGNRQTAYGLKWFFLDR